MKNYTVDNLFEDVCSEVSRARERFPGPNLNLLAFHEEAGELTRAVLRLTQEEQGCLEDVRKELVQCMAMLVRVASEGDESCGLTPCIAEGIDEGVDDDA